MHKSARLDPLFNYMHSRLYAVSHDRAIARLGLALGQISIFLFFLAHGNTYSSLHASNGQALLAARVPPPESLSEACASFGIINRNAPFPGTDFDLRSVLREVEFGKENLGRELFRGRLFAGQDEREDRVAQVEAI